MPAWTGCGMRAVLRQRDAPGGGPCRDVDRGHLISAILAFGGLAAIDQQRASIRRQAATDGTRASSGDKSRNSAEPFVVSGVDRRRDIQHRDQAGVPMLIGSGSLRGCSARVIDHVGEAAGTINRQGHRLPARRRIGHAIAVGVDIRRNARPGDDRVISAIVGGIERLFDIDDRNVVVPPATDDQSASTAH